MNVSELFFSTFFFCFFNSVILTFPYLFFLSWQFFRPSFLFSEYVLYRRIYISVLVWFFLTLILGICIVFPVYITAFFIFSETFLSNLTVDVTLVPTHIRVSDFLNNYVSCLFFCYIFSLPILFFFLYKPIEFLFFFKGNRKIIFFIYTFFISCLVPLDFSTVYVYTIVFSLLIIFTEFVFFFMYTTFLLF